MTTEPIRIQDWRDLCGKWVHLHLQPPKESHDVELFGEDGKPGWKGPIHASAVAVEFAGDVLMCDLQHEKSPTEQGAIILPEFTDGLVTVTFRLPTAGGVLL